MRFNTLSVFIFCLSACCYQIGWASDYVIDTEGSHAYIQFKSVILDTAGWSGGLIISQAISVTMKISHQRHMLRL